MQNYVNFISDQLDNTKRAKNVVLSFQGWAGWQQQAIQVTVTEFFGIREVLLKVALVNGIGMLRRELNITQQACNSNMAF